MKKGSPADNTSKPLKVASTQGSFGSPDTRPPHEDSHEALIDDARGGTRTRTLLRAATFKVAAYQLGYPGVGGS